MAAFESEVFITRGSITNLAAGLTATLAQVQLIWNSLDVAMEFPKPVCASVEKLWD